MSLFSIGHSNIETEKFLALLVQYNIEILVDVRSAPYSRYNPQFNRETLQRSVLASGLEYLYLGDKIGGMPKAPQLLTPERQVDFERIEAAGFYQTGIAQLQELATQNRAAFMCAEADFRHCHRYKLITRTLVKRGFIVTHILHSGATIASVATDFMPAQQSFGF